MSDYSRREFLYLLAMLSLLPRTSLYAAVPGNEESPAYPATMEVLKKAFQSEITAHRHYIGYTRKALSQQYENIAYLFHAFSFSEKIHADNYDRILTVFGDAVAEESIAVTIKDTKSNLKAAAQKEMHKIKKVYPDFIRRLEKESCEDAIISAMYSYKCHKQHKEKISEILKYSGMFFGSVAKEIENMKLNFHVCRICGSTIDVEPDAPCSICNMSVSNYFKVARPEKHEGSGLHSSL
jgi:rubrerythrin